MSNFICSECGMTNIDCGYAGYKTPKEIELEKKVHILNEANMKLENKLGHFANLSKKVKELEKRLSQQTELFSQEQDRVKMLLERLADADKTIAFYDNKDFHYTLGDGTVMGAEPAHKYLVKWRIRGVK